ncbi:MAG: GyrI-like domain-containing protein [Alteromonadales bacterium]|nr:GyrI-like domain-containing protein [Alteromonadales bacterium]
MKLTHSLVTTLTISLLLAIIYFFMPKSPPAFEDMQPRLVELPELSVTGVEIYGNLSEGDYPTAWRKISNKKHQIDADCKGDFTYGIELYGKVTKTKWHYLAGCEMSTPSKLTEKMAIELTTRVLPKNLYVVFTYNGAIKLKRMGGLYSYIFNKWLPKNGYRPAGYYNFERYNERFLGAEEPLSEFELFVPITSASAQ